MKSVYRFVGRRLDQRVDTLNLPSVSIADETRFVLRAPPDGAMLWQQEARVGVDGVLRIERPLPPPFDRASKILGTVHLATADESVALPRRVMKTRHRPGGNALALALEVPPELVGSETLSVTVSGVGIGATSFSRYETRPVRIPDGARLDFGIGVFEPEIGHDPVEFELSACAGNDCESLFSETLDPSDPEQRGWHDRRLSLTALAGQTRRFAFGARRLRASAEFSIPVWANPTLYAPSPRGADQVNVILLSIDTLRADHLTSYGYRHDTAPFIEERFGRGGTLFEECTASTPVTAPSHMTLFTSLQPMTHGVTDGLKVLSKAIRTLPELIRARRIDTAAFTENGWVSVHQGFARGFNSFSENKSPEIMVPEGEVDATFAQAKRWLENNHDKRFFLFLHTYQVHAPYAPPERYADLFAEHDGRSIDEHSPTHVQYRANYDREIRYVDDELRSLFATLETLGLDRTTVFVLTSDHGEEFLEHGLLYHGGNLYEESVRVPLMFTGPGIAAGRRIATHVGHKHLMPTILELFGIAPPEGREQRGLLGPMLGREQEALASEPVFSEAWVTFQPGLGPRGRRFDPPSFSVRLGSRKLTRHRQGSGHRYEFYDLARDPLEQHDLFPSRGSEAQDLVALIERYQEEREQERRALLGEEAEASPAPQLDAEREEKLKALGYIE
ncbi:MAG: sulfatase [Deltaproteobacteria bacterium]|nr:sulfatase [Deltaproteobacteria bacterium]